MPVIDRCCFIIDDKDRRRKFLLKHLIDLGVKYKQQTVLYLPVDDQGRAYLYDTMENVGRKIDTLDRNAL